MGKHCTEKGLNNRLCSSNGLHVVSKNKREESIQDEKHIIHDNAKN